MANYVTVPGWRRSMGILLPHEVKRRGLGQDDDFGSTDYSIPGDLLSTSGASTPDIYPSAGPYFPDLSTPASASSAQSDSSFETELDDMLGTTPAPASAPTQTPTFSSSSSSPYAFCQSGCSSVTYGNGQTGFFDPNDGTYYDSQGNDITAQVAAYGGAKVGGAANPALVAQAEGIQSSSNPFSGLAQAISRVFSPSPSTGVPSGYVRNASGQLVPVSSAGTIGSGSSIASWILPVAIIGAIALIASRR
jgi:hypothetical protein